MSMPIGTRIGNKLYQRCQECGDSIKNPDKGHLIIYLDNGTIHCSRCGYHDQLTLGTMISTWADYPVEAAQKAAPVPGVPDYEMIPAGSPGPAGRISYVEPRWSAEAAEIFAMRKPSGETTGYHMRGTIDKVSQSRGLRTFGFYGSTVPTVIDEGFTRVVEGPYDVVYPVDICTFGLPNKTQVDLLTWRTLVLCPDGGVYRDKQVLKGWIQPFIRGKSLISHVEMIPDGADPDECPVNRRIPVPWEEFKPWYYQRLKSLS